MIDEINKSARVLLVEDNEINREVAEDVLTPLNLDLDTANDGMEAIAKIKSGNYDLIFMDYLMPVMDGKEATTQLRDASSGVAKDLPIIALTASADEVDGLLAVGMNDYIIKPLTLDNAKDMLIKFLPDHALDIVERYNNALSEEITEAIPQIAGIDAHVGIANCGSLRMLKKMFIEYAALVDFRASRIRRMLDVNEINGYRIEVHGLKSASNLIGALDLSSKFEELEKAARNNEISKLVMNTSAVLNEYESMKKNLDDFAANQSLILIEVPNKRLKSILEMMASAAENMFMDGVDANMNEIAKCKIPDKYREDFEKLGVYVANVDFDNISKTAKQLMSELED